MIGVLALAFPLTACGRKGPLDPPPGGQVLEQGVSRTPTTRRAGAAKPQDYDEDGRPIPAEGPKKKLPGDWLID